MTAKGPRALRIARIAVKKKMREFQKRKTIERTFAEKALKKTASQRKIKYNINFCERIIEILENQEARKELASGKLPLRLQKMSHSIAMLEVMAETIPDQTFLQMGIYLPERKTFFASGNKMLKAVLYFGYWMHGPYFTPVHVGVKMASSYLPDRIRRRYELRASRLLEKSFTREGRLKVSEADLDGIIKELKSNLETNKKLLQKR
ncbi:MAG: hypothetical protein Q7R70_01475 [Candidatus Diapherotrites archaeon]|nr:hypothetical protein [Candidatus Diapherotrites archaeon]